jgi:transcriptional regulator with XRE-family HTH domain
MAKGYSTLTVQEIDDANPNLLGVKLGKICIKRDLPVSDVAEFFGVSRVTIYAWFRGKTVVSGKHADKMQKLITKLA